MNPKIKKLLIVILLLTLGVTAGYYFFPKINQTNSDIKQNNCVIENPDSDGYLVKICKYLKARENTIITSIDPIKYNIKSIEDGEYWKIENGKEIKTEAIIVRLDCCYMGDVAYFDKETKEMVQFSVGDQ